MHIDSEPRSKRQKTSEEENFKESPLDNIKDVCTIDINVNYEHVLINISFHVGYSDCTDQKSGENRKNIRKTT